MGIINCSPDSFFEGSRYKTEAEVLKVAEQMLHDGADFLDIGGYSSRPNAIHIDFEEELCRVEGIAIALKKEFSECILSIDTFRSNVAERMLNIGVSIINDISAGELDPNMFSVIKKHKPVYCMMHMRGNPTTMSQLCNYDQLIPEIFNYFNPKIKELQEANVNDLIIDPGFGFAKNLDQNYELLKRLNEFKLLGLPILAGLSRKSMIYKVLKIEATEALNGTSILNTIALMNGANILRVHDVKEAKQCIQLVSLLNIESTEN